MKPLFKEMNLSLPFRSVCSHCKNPLGFIERKYSSFGISSRSCCEECRDRLGGLVNIGGLWGRQSIHSSKLHSVLLS